MRRSVSQASYASTRAVATATGHGRRVSTSRAVASAAGEVAVGREAPGRRLERERVETGDEVVMGGSAAAYDAWARFMASATRPRRVR